MANARNVVSLVGNLVKDPEVKNGNLAIFTVAVSFSAYDTTTNPNNTGFFDAVMFLGESKTAAFVRNQIENGNFKKGTSVTVMGSLEQTRYSTQEGKTGYGLRIKLDDITFAGGSAGTTQDESNEASAPQEF